LTGLARESLSDAISAARQGWEGDPSPLGYAHMSAPANRLHTEREPISGFATFYSDVTD
jgi:hypothetical protein